ncbi:MAG: DUF721 domain-containing protein [Rhodobacterales bacterium]|jgi:hypothetical protein
MDKRRATTKGFARTGNLLEKRIKSVGKSRGFAQTRLLTHWAEIAGAEIAAVARPIEVTYGRQDFGATLSLLTTGAQAPMLEMQKDQLREKINSVYGYNAISKIRITQTAPTGFAEGQITFAPAKTAAFDRALDPGIASAATEVARAVNDDSLRHALETLGKNVLSKDKLTT